MHIGLKRTALNLLLVIGLVIGLGVGCHKSTTVSTPAVPANVQVAGFSRTLADGISTSSRTLAALRDNGKVTEAETLIVQNYILTTARTGKAMDAELLSSDDWPTQRAKIVQLWVATGLSNAKSNLSTTAGLVLDTILSVVNQILAAVGGPAI